MTLLLGVASLSAAALLLAWAYGAHRRPVPRAWTRFEAASSAIGLVFVLLVPIGLGSLAAILLDPAETLATLDAPTLGAAAGLAVLCWWAVPRLIAPARRAAGTVAAPSPLEPRPPARTPPVQGRRGSGAGQRRRKAA
jgi:hypothetical protein